ESDALETKVLAKTLHESLTDHTGPHGTAALAHQAGHRRCAGSAPAHQLEQLQIGTDVDPGAEVAHPVMHRQANGCKRPGADPDTRPAERPFALNAKLLQESSNHLVKSLQVSWNSQPQAIEGQDRVEGELAWQVEQAAAATIDPTNRPAPATQFLRTAENMCPASLPPNRDQRRMLADGENCLI